MPSGSKRRLSSSTTDSTSNGTSRANASSSANQPALKVFRRGRRRRGTTRVALPTVRAEDEFANGSPRSSGTNRSSTWNAKANFKLASPRNGVVLNLGLLETEADAELSPRANGGSRSNVNANANANANANTSDPTSTSSFDLKLNVPTAKAKAAKLLVEWDPEQASENHVVYEVYNAHVYLHGLFAPTKALKVPIILVSAMQELQY